MNRRWTLAFCSLAAAFLLCTIGPRVFAQGLTYGAIHGTVTDASGAVIPGATVSALNTSTGIAHKTTTDATGYYIFPQLHIGGPYTVVITKPGFQTSRLVGIILHVNDNLFENATLQTGTVSQTVRVSANAVQVQTSDTQLQETLTSNQIAKMPLLGQDATILQKLQAGTVESSDRFGNYSSNGAQTQQNSYLLDGSDINDAPLQTQGITINPDALAEVTFVTSTSNPQYSRNSGAIANEILKSGTNQFHGDGFEFYRDTFMNLGGYFALPGQRPVFHQNLYGGTLGGPVVRNKLFFFTAYQGFRNRNAFTQQTSVPTASQLGTTTGIANLSQDANAFTGGINSAGLTSLSIPVSIMTPAGPCGPNTARTTWSSCFPAGSPVEILTSSFNPIATKLLSYVPPPNVGSAVGNTYDNFNALNTAASDQGIIRLDYHLSQNDELWASTVFQSNPTTQTLPFTGATLPGWSETDARHIKIFNASWTHTFNPDTLNEVRGGYYRFNFAAVEPSVVTPPSALGFTISPQDTGAESDPLIGVSGYFTLGFSNNGPQPRRDTNMDYADNFTRIIGNHNVMVGAEIEKFGVNNPFYANNNGNFSFNGSGTYTSGDPLLDFLVGIPSSYAQGSGAQIDAHSWDIYGYAQDDWKTTSSLTLNYGLGYEIMTPFANLQYGGKAVICFTPGAQSKVFPTAQASLLYPGDPGCNNQGGASPKFDKIAPRVGIDWSPSGKALGWLTGPAGEHEFALRGGFGVYYNRDSEEAQLQNLEDPPFGTTSAGVADIPGLSPSFADPWVDIAGNGQETNKFPYTFPTPGQTINFAQFVPYDLSTISPAYNVPTAYNFNLNIQRQIPGDQILTVGYVGSLGDNLVRAYEADRITAAGHAAAVAACTAAGTSACLSNASFLSLNDPQWFRETSGNFLSVGRVYTNGSSNYNSMQVSLAKNPTHGIYYTLAYTWSHALDNGSGFESSGFGNDIAGTNWVPGFRYLSYGNSDFDARNRFVASYGYQIPLLAAMRQNRFINEALGGWNIGGITALQSGFPAPIGDTGQNRSLYCNAATFSFYGCPDTAETSTFHPALMNPRSTSQHYWFNPGDFSPEPLGTFGNVKRNFIHGPGFNYTDMNLFKNFPLGRHDSPRVLELMLQAYNVFNHPNFATPDGNVNDGAAFGTITSVIQPSADGGAGDPQPGRVVQIAGRIEF